MLWMTHLMDAQIFTFMTGQVQASNSIKSSTPSWRYKWITRSKTNTLHILQQTTRFSGYPKSNTGSNTKAKGKVRPYRQIQAFQWYIYANLAILATR